MSILSNSCIYACDLTALQQLVNQYEVKYGIPNNLLWSVAKVESAYNPYAINVQGKTHNARTLQEALRIVDEKLQLGITNIDLGLMQINWHYHSGNFNNIADLFDLKVNIEYGARFLKQLHKSHGSWQHAVQYYHSARPEYHGKYGRKVLAAWLNS